jgi:hypothetical protein
MVPSVITLTSILVRPRGRYCMNESFEKAQERERRDRRQKRGNAKDGVQEMK